LGGYISWDRFTDGERVDMIAKSSKQHALIIDHVGNVHRHGLPDAVQNYSLERRERKSRSIVIIPVRTCPGCGATYQRTEIACPYCHVTPEPVGRSAPHQVDGDLEELSPDVLHMMRGVIDAPPKFPYGAAPGVVAGIRGHWHQKMKAQQDLRAMMALWAGYQTQATSGPELRKAMKTFYLTFGIDVLGAQNLSRKDAVDLTERIRNAI